MSPSQTRPRLLSDENISKAVVESLKREGFDVARCPSGASDSEVASLALSEKRVLVTFDRHFGNIFLFPPKQYGGIVLIRINPSLRNVVMSTLLKLLIDVKPSEFEGRLFVLSASGFRRYPK